MEGEFEPAQAKQCNAMAVHPFQTTSRETKPTRPFPCLVCVAGEDEYFKIKVRLLQVLLYPLFHTCNFFAFLFLSCQSRGLLLSSSNGSVRQYKHTPFSYGSIIRLAPRAEQNIPINCVFSRMASYEKIRNAQCLLTQ